MVVEAVDDARVNVTSVVSIPGPNGAGLDHGEYQLATRDDRFGERPKVFKLPKDSRDVEAVMRRHGVEWPAGSGRPVPVSSRAHPPDSDTWYWCPPFTPNMRLEGSCRHQT